MNSSHTQRTLRGVKYNFFNTISKTFLHFVVGIVLARLIPPKDFGILGMAYVFIGLANLFSTLGMGAAIIQRKELSPTHLRTASTLSLILGTIIYVIFYFAAPVISAFYNETALTEIIRVISVLFIFQGIYSITRGLSARKLDFKTIFNVEFISFVTGQGILSVVLAFMGYGVWSLVWGRIATSILSFILLFIKEKHSIKPYLNKQEIKDLLGFGSGVSLIGIFNYGASNVDYLIIGKLLNAIAVGLYTRAFNLMTMPIAQISQTISGVLFSAYSEIQDDLVRLRNTYLKSIEILAILGFPIIAAMIINADYIIIGLYGENWSGAIEVFQILSIAAFFKIITHTQGAVTKATGRVFNEVWRQLIYLLFISIGVYTGVKFFGLEGAGYAIILASIWLYISMSYLVTDIINLKFLKFLKSQLNGLIISIIVYLTNMLFRSFLLEQYFSEINPTIKLGIVLILSLVTAIISFLLFPNKIRGEAHNWILNKIRTSLPAKFSTII